MLPSKLSFKEFILKELHQVDASLSSEIKEYLSDLLCFYIFTHRVYEHHSRKGKKHRVTLVEIYGRIPKAGAHERVYLFKKIGDLSLYFSGFFRSAIEGKIVSRSYYEEMGEAAYEQLGGLYHQRQDNIFKSLAENFKSLGETLFCIQKKAESRKKESYLLSFPPVIN